MDVCVLWVSCVVR